MIKQIQFLILALFILNSCGTDESREIKKDPNYNYVEIEECTIPIAKRFKKLKVNKEYLYNFSYHPNNLKDYTEHSLMDISKRREDDYINARESITQSKKSQLVSETKEKYFKIINWKMINRLLKDDNYYLYGEKTKISITNAKKEDVNYLLNYCEKTWKLNKGEK